MLDVFHVVLWLGIIGFFGVCEQGGLRAAQNTACVASAPLLI